MLKKLFKRKIFIFSLITLLLLGLYLVYEYHFNKMEVETFTVRIGKIKKVINDTGRVEVAIKETISTKLGGKVETINVEVGDKVKKGQLLGWLTQRESLMAQKKAAEKAYEAQKAQTSLILEENPDYKLLEALLVQAQINYDKAKRVYDQLKVLYEMGAVSKEEFIEAENNYVYQEKNLQAVKSKTNELQITRLKKGSLMNLVQAEAELLMIEENIKDTEMVAEIDGVVLKKMVKEKEVALPGSVLLEIGDLNKKEIRAEILTEKVKDLKLGQRVEIMGDIIGENEIIMGKVAKIDPVAILTHSLLGAEEYRVPITISLDEQNEKLIPGSEVDIRIIIKEEENVLLIKKEAVFEVNGNDCVFVIKNNIAELQKVTTGLEGEDFIQIIEGLRKGDRVILDPPNELKPGQKVKEKPFKKL